MEIEFKASKRTLQGTGASRRLRRAGRVPGILYGGGSDAQAIELDHNALYHALRREAFHSSVLTMDLEGRKEMVLLRDVQMHPFRQLVLHIDFQRVDATHAIHQKVPLHFVHAELSPGVKFEGGMLSHVINEIDVKCMPKDLPGFIEIDLGHLHAGQSIHLSEIKMPPGVELVTHKNEDQVVASIVLSRGSASDEPGAEGAADAAGGDAAKK
ncbi:MAG: 50S ribosomal protein L25/general stress protein Ctc [Rhodocyclaceae bacterium]|nr:50S ribosomal protein L25/general stress protein Ctc [Rhodocyclaceae bacterium]MBX3667375.1 50S ribosomal protein L25/general stress protein Ctc [Rhodocyclaceae bacterium]